MFTVITLMIAGMLLGYLARKKSLAKINHLITLLIWLLLFLLGIEVGGNPQIIHAMHTIGLEALLIAVGGTLGSACLAWLLWRMLFSKKGGEA